MAHRWIGVLLLVYLPWSANADVRDTLQNLYGGDGITLRHTGHFDHSAHFNQDSLTQLSTLSTQATRFEAPLVSVDSGAVFEFDPVIEDFVEVQGQLGPMFAERPQSLGNGRISLGFSYSDQNFSRFEGEALDSYTVRLFHEDVGGPGVDICIGGPPGACYFFEEDYIEVEMDIDFSARTLALYADYGLTERLDVGILVPIVRTEMTVRAQARVVEGPTKTFFPHATLHSFDPSGVDGDAAFSRASESHVGLGDVMLRGKYHAYNGERLSVAVAAQLRAPTGDYKELQGTGRIGGRTAVLVSMPVERPWGTWVPHLNLAYDFNGAADGADQVQAVLGFDLGFQIGGLESSFGLDVIHRQRTNRNTGAGDALTDIAAGYKWRWAGRSSFFVGTRFPINRNHGLRSDVVFELGGQMSI